MERINVYLAGSMFCEADRLFNEIVAHRIRERLGEYINLYVPQENKSINDKTKCANSIDIFWGDYNRIQNTDVLIARIDGDIPPSGTSAEIGLMAQRYVNWTNDENAELLHRPTILGLCTDSRNPKATYLDAKNEMMQKDDIESQYCYYNLFTVGCIKVAGKLLTSVDNLIKALEEEIHVRITN